MKIEVTDGTIPHGKLLTILNVIFLVLAVGLWGFLIGTFTPAVVSYNSMEEVHNAYNLLRIFEDGSYEGQTSGGVNVTGCITGGLCSKEIVKE